MFIKINYLSQHLEYFLKRVKNSALQILFDFIKEKNNKLNGV